MKFDIMMGTTFLMMFLMVLMISPIFYLLVTELMQQSEIDSLDQACFIEEKIRYCNSIGMYLGSIVVTPFLGSPYNKEACVSENSEKIIEYNDLNVDHCKRQK